MNLTMTGQFFDTGFEGVATYTDCWPCEHCGVVVAAGIGCRDDDGSVCEMEAVCEDCQERCNECGINCIHGERTEHGCQYGMGYTFVRPNAQRQFRLSSGEHGWWDEQGERA